MIKNPSLPGVLAKQALSVVNLFHRISIADKLVLGFLPLLCLLMIVSIYALINLNRMNKLADSILRTDMPVIHASDKMIEIVFDQEQYARRFTILKAQNLIDLYWEKDRAFNALLKKVENVSEGAIDWTTQLGELHRTYNDMLVDGLIHRKEEHSDASRRTKEKLKSIQGEMVHLIKQLSAKALKDQNLKTGTSSNIGMVAFRASAAICLSGFVLSVAMALLITRHIAGAIRILKRATENISNGQYDAVPALNNKDELGDLAEAFTKMARRLKELEAMNLDKSPLTRLPGGISIEKQLTERIAADRSIAFCLIDIDHFKAYNDRYGYAKGNEVIKSTAEIIKQAVQHFGSTEDFVGHIGGDDFVVITETDRCESICHEVIRQFDEAMPSFYTEHDRMKGGVNARNREGELTSHPLASISIAVVTNVRMKLVSHIQYGEIAAGLKEHAKSIAGSTLIVDRFDPNQPVAYPFNHARTTITRDKDPKCRAVAV